MVRVTTHRARPLPGHGREAGAGGADLCRRGRAGRRVVKLWFVGGGGRWVVGKWWAAQPLGRLCRSISEHSMRSARALARPEGNIVLRRENTRSEAAELATYVKANRAA